MKKCPYCAEKIQDAAIVCRYCGKNLPDQQNEKESNRDILITERALRRDDAIEKSMPAAFPEQDYEKIRAELRKLNNTISSLVAIRNGLLPYGDYLPEKENSTFTQASFDEKLNSLWEDIESLMYAYEMLFAYIVRNSR